MAKYPKQVFLKYEDGGNGPDYLVAYDAAIQCAEMGNTVKVGIYKLIEVQTVKGVCITNKVPL